MPRFETKPVRRTCQKYREGTIFIRKTTLTHQKSHDHAIISDLRNGFFQPLGKRERAGARQLTKNRSQPPSKNTGSSLRRRLFHKRCLTV